MASNDTRGDNIDESVSNDVTDAAPLRSIIDTPLTDSLINAVFHSQNSDGSFPADRQLADLFNVNFDLIKDDLTRKGLDRSIADEVHRLVSTASILFYFLYHSQKTQFPVDIDAIQQFVSKARAELESFSMKDDPIMQTYIDKGELAVNYVIAIREKHADLCQKLKLNESTWESYVQRLMGLGQ